VKTAQRFERFPPYTPIEPFEVLSARLGIPIEQIVKLDANENPYGPSPKAKAALADLPFAHIYPDPESRALRAGLAEFTGAPVENLMAGAGADELIDLLLRVLLEAGDCVLNCPPTFGMYPFDTLLNAGQLVEAPRREDFSLDLEQVLAAIRETKPKAVFLTAPNNPDGRFPSQEEVETLLAQDLLVVLDEAYIEFTSQGGRLGERLSRIGEVAQRENLVVLRTFSKWAGLAGLRVGYGAFPQWMLAAMWKAKQPYNVNVAATAAALASLADLEERAATVERLRQERERLHNILAQTSFLRPFPSQANFILCRVLDRPAKALKEQLARRGVLLRHYETPLLRGFIRASVGKPEDTDALAAALVEIGGER
jgi:histidinol-phosphate aminotransferase